jgi:hypothetical protein
MNQLPELLERFRRGAELIASMTTGAAGPELDFSPGEGKWSVRQIVCHLADSECVASMRFRQLIAEENPAIQAYDQDAWASKLDYSRRKISLGLETFRRIRSDNYDLLKELPAETFSRRGTHSERGSVSLLDMLEIYAAHAEGHARQIRQVRDAYKAARAAAAPPRPAPAPAEAPVE